MPRAADSSHPQSACDHQVTSKLTASRSHLRVRIRFHLHLIVLRYVHLCLHLQIHVPLLVRLVVVTFRTMVLVGQNSSRFRYSEV